MKFEIISEIVGVEIIAVGGSIRDLARLNKVHGDGRWRKLKGRAWADEWDIRGSNERWFVLWS